MIGNIKMIKVLSKLNRRIHKLFQIWLNIIERIILKCRRILLVRESILIDKMGIGI